MYDGILGGGGTHQVALLQLQKFRGAHVFVHVIVICEDAFAVD